MRLPALLALLVLPAMTGPAASPGGGRMMGVPSAPVKVEVFSDFQCPACKSLHEETLRPLAVDYVRTGKVYLINRYFPLNGHAYSRPSANLVCAAERIGKYQQVADAVFASQAVWSANGQVEAAALKPLTPAEAAKVRALAKDPSVAAEVQKDYELGEKIPVRQTPTILISKGAKQYPLTGFVSYQILRRFIDELIAK